MFTIGIDDIGGPIYYFDQLDVEVLEIRPKVD
jgi:hypothetical protein